MTKNTKKVAKKRCRVCGKKIKTMVFKGTSLCSDDCADSDIIEP